MLTTSSVFSFVHIARVVYSDRLLIDDAHFILEDNCLLLNAELETAIQNHLNAKENQIREYIYLLIPKNHTVNFSKGEQTSLSEKAKIFTDIKKENSDLYNSHHLSIETIIGHLDNFSKGNFTESNYQLFSTDISEITTAVDQNIKTLKENIKTSNKEIREIHGRLAQYHNVNDPAYIDLTKKLESKEKSRDKLVAKRDKWSDFKFTLELTKNDVDNLKSYSLANIINDKALSMLHILESGQENSNIQTTPAGLVDAASEIHNSLLSNMVPDTDERMKKYTSFLTNAKTYDLLTKQKQIIEDEIEHLYGNDNLREKNNITMWTNFWDERLSVLKDVLKILPNDCYPLEKKQENIQNITNLRRLYLFELNDFELEFSLLFGRHRYKGMLIFSFIFAFGIDLFSLATGKLISRFKEPLL